MKTMLIGLITLFSSATFANLELRCEDFTVTLTNFDRNQLTATWIKVHKEDVKVRNRNTGEFEEDGTVTWQGGPVHSTLAGASGYKETNMIIRSTRTFALKLISQKEQDAKITFFNGSKFVSCL